MILDKKLTKEDENLESERLKIISKGGHVMADIKSNTTKYKIFNIRMTVEMYNNIEKAVNERVGINKTGWILECLDEKLKKIE